MKVLVVYAHPDPDSFTHALLEHLTRGLADGGHELTVYDLYATGFDPVFTQHDGTQFLHESLPDELLEQANLPEAVMRTAKDPIRRYLARRWLRGKSPRDIAKAIAERQPKDVREQQQLVADAEGLVFVRRSSGWASPRCLRAGLSASSRTASPTRSRVRAGRAT